MNGDDAHVTEWALHIRQYEDTYMDAVYKLIVHLAESHGISEVALLAGSITPDSLLTTHVRAHFLESDF